MDVSSSSSSVGQGTGGTGSAAEKNGITYPGDDPTISPGEGFEWRGSGDPASGKGNWYNPITGEKWNADLNHHYPVGSHWDYTDTYGKSFRVFPDGRIEPK